MKAATIVPATLLNEVREEDYNMCLFQEVKNNPEYAEFFRNQVMEGKFVIMDNGAAEGQNPTPEEFAEQIKKVNPSEIVLPDVPYDKCETIRQTKAAWMDYETAGLLRDRRVMMVPQGKTYQEWVECAEEFLHQAPVTIGISKFMCRVLQEEMGKDANVRLELVEALIAFYGSVERLQESGIEIHLLGCNSTVSEYAEIEKAFPGVVRGTDSAIAYVYTRNEKLICDNLKRPDDNEIDFVHGDAIDTELLKSNIKAWNRACEVN